MISFIWVLIMLSGTAAFVVEDFVPNAPDSDKEMRQQCPLCDSTKKLKDMRDHVGYHILLRLRGGKECGLLNPVRLSHSTALPR